MSKLYNTLEQIRRNESYPISGKQTKPSAKNSSVEIRRKAIFLLTAIVACAAFFYFYPPLTGKGDKSTEIRQGANHQAAPISAPNRETVATVLTVPEGNPSRLNNLAAAYIKNGEHWKGIYLLSLITEKEPKMIEAFINLGVALAEIGLFEPSKRYLNEAIRLDPRNPALRENLLILRKRGIIDQSFNLQINADKRAQNLTPATQPATREALLKRSEN